ncbi:MAG: restriction endonuclease subunit S [Aeromonas salmonicida]
MVPNAWSIKPVANILEKVSNPVNVNPEMVYHEIGIRSHGKGIFYKEPIFGQELGNKRVFYVEPDCFVVNIVFAWEQAIAKTTTDEKGKIASHRFPMFKPRKDLCDIDYILYLFKSRKGKYLLELASPGGAGRNKTLGQSEFSKLELILPPIEEQKKIAKILSTWDKAISTTEQLLVNSQQQKKALMQQLLTGKKRLLDNNEIKSRASKTPYATLPSDWGEIAMEEVSSFITKGATPTTYGFDWQDTGIPFLRSECVGEDGFKESGLAFICDEAHEAMKRSKVFTGDLLITITGNVGRICKLPDHICEANINQHIAKVTLNLQQVNTDFIYHCLRDIKYRNYFERITTGQAYPQISLVQVRDVVIPLPSREEQHKIANILSTADQEITALQQKLAALQQEKKALMQQLLTGKRRVKVEVAA